MKLVALMLVREDAWILGYSLRVALAWCDAVVLINHGCSSAVQHIVDEVNTAGPKPVYHFDVPASSDWKEMDLRQKSLDHGREIGGTHFAIVDADEALTANRLDQMRQSTFRLKPGQHNACRMVSPWHSVLRHRIDGPFHEHSCLSLAFADAPGVTWKPKEDGYQFHQRLPHGIEKQPASPLDLLAAGGVFHYQTCSRRRLLVKACWYKVLETVMYPGRTTPERLNEIYDWQLRDEQNAVLQEIPDRWTKYPGLWIGSTLRIRPEDEPWQLAELRRMMKEHDPAVFAGLDFHELAPEVLP